MVMRSGVKYLFLLFIKLTLLDIAVEYLSLKALLFPWVIGWIGLNNENGFYLHGLQVAAGLLRRAGNPGCFPNQPNQGCFCYLVLIWCWTILLNECWLWAHITIRYALKFPTLVVLMIWELDGIYFFVHFDCLKRPGRKAWTVCFLIDQIDNLNCMSRLRVDQNFLSCCLFSVHCHRWIDCWLKRSQLKMLRRLMKSCDTHLGRILLFFCQNFHGHMSNWFRHSFSVW